MLNSAGRVANQLSHLAQHAVVAGLCRYVLSFRLLEVGPEHPDTHRSDINHANELGELGRHAEAAAQANIQRHAVGGLGREHLDMLDAGNSLTSQLSDLGQHADAAELLQRILASRRRTQGSQHFDTLRTGMDYANQLGLLGRHEEAEEMLRQSYNAIMQRVFGPDHPDTLKCGNNLSIRLACWGRHVEAVQLLCIMADARQRVPAPAILAC